MLPGAERDELDEVEIDPKERSMGICATKGCGKPTLARGLCSKCYQEDRGRQKKAGTWTPTEGTNTGKTAPAKPPQQTPEGAAAGKAITEALDSVTEKFKPEAGGPASEPAPKAAPQQKEPPEEAKGPVPSIFPHKGKIYLLAEIRVMTEEQLREMFG